VLSVSLRDGAGGAVLAADDADRLHSTASIGKIVLLAEIAVRFVDGRLARGEPLTRTAEDAVADSGLWQHLGVDTLPAADLAALVGAVSDNLATNVLLRRVGMTAVTERAHTLGLERTALLDRVRDVRRPSDPPALSVGTAAELSSLMLSLHRGQVRSKAVSRQVLEWLSLDTDTSMVAGALGLDPLAHTEIDRGMRLSHKTGTSTGVRADVGLATGPRGAVAYAVLATFDDADRDSVLASMFRVGERVRRFIAG
jgi:beta-lactamase class A